RALLPLRVPVGVDLGVLRPLLGQLFLREDRLDRADGDAGAAIDTGLGVNVQLVLALELRLVLLGVDAVHRAHLDAGGVLRVHARFRDDVGHQGSSLWASLPAAILTQNGQRVAPLKRASRRASLGATARPARTSCNAVSRALRKGD